MLSLQAPGHCSSGKNLTEHWLSRFSLLITVLLSLEVSASLAGTGVVPFVSWSASATSFHLQSTLTMSPPGWTTITNDIFTDNGTNQYADLAPGAARFFRLAH